MASIHTRQTTGKWQVAFRWLGKPYSRCTGTTLKRDAELIKRRVEDTIWRLRNAGLSIPAGTDPGDFIYTGGRLPEPAESVTDRPLTLGELFERYTEALAPGAKEANTLYTEGIHKKHLLRLLGPDRTLESIGAEVIQTRYVKPRSAEVTKATIIKELKTLRHMWGWAVEFKLLNSRWCPTQLERPES